MNVHFHVLWLDGVYGGEPGRGRPEFHAQQEVNDADVQPLVQRIRDRALRKAGKWVDADAATECGEDVGDELLPGLASAEIEGRAALGERAGQRDGRIGRDSRWEPLVRGPLCAEMDVFSLHAGVGTSSCSPGPPGTHFRHPPARARPQPSGRMRPFRARSGHCRALRTHRSRRYSAAPSST